ncbi:MAG: DegV family protein [Mycobacteriaceae bacterium]|nr:DegV family protein [Mycobacteriaceae bacterium]
MSRHVAVVTDSTACLPQSVVRDLGISVVQQQLQVGEQTHEEARIPPEQLIDAMRDRVPVATAPPHPGAFFWAYQDAANADAAAVVSLHISAKQSQTCKIARDTANQSRIPVYVVDSATTGMSLGYAVLAAATAAAGGGSVRDVLQAAHQRFTTSTELIYVDSLEYLRRGGRIGAAAAMVGTALSVKPLLTMSDGQVAPLNRVFGADRALRKMVDTAVELAGAKQVDLAVEHFGAPELAVELADRLRARVPSAQQCMITQVSAIIGAHVGPGALGVTVSPR